MPTISESVLIRRPRHDVVAYVDDVSREREWQPSLREASQEPAGPSRIGTRKRYVSEFLGKRIVNVYEATEFEEGHSITWKTTPDSAARLTTRIRWETVGDDTRMTLTMEGTPSGVFRFMPSRVVEEAYRRQLREALARLKDRLETRA